MNLLKIKFIEVSLLIILAVVSDIITYKVKNAIIITFIILGFLTNLYLHGLSGLCGSALAAALPAVILFILFTLRMLGAGDIKLFCAIGAITGIEFVMYDIAFSFLSGGVIAIFIMLVKGNMKQRKAYLLNYLKTCLLTASLQPYGDFSVTSDGAKFRFTYAIACGTAAAMLTQLLKL